MQYKLNIGNTIMYVNLVSDTEAVNVAKRLKADKLQRRLGTTRVDGKLLTKYEAVAAW